jgi:hypothetical protein
MQFDLNEVGSYTGVIDPGLSWAGWGRNYHSIVL